MHTEYIDTTGAANIQMIKHLRSLDEASERHNHLVLNLNKFTNVTPFSILLLFSKITSLKEKYPDKKLDFIYNQGYSHIGYLEHMGFFSLVDEPTQKTVNEVNSNDTCVPMRKIDREDLRKTGKFSDVDAVTVISREIAEKLSEVREEQEGLEFMLREMIRNSFEHSGTETVYLAAQRWDVQDLMEIAIFDQGKGIPQSLRSRAKKYNKRKKTWNDDDLIKLALKPGVTAQSNFWTAADEADKNSGYGLYVVKELCKVFSEGFIVASGSHAILESSRQRRIEGKAYFISQIVGVGLQLRFKVSKIKNFKEERAKIIDQGQEYHRREFKRQSNASGRSSGDT